MTVSGLLLTAILAGSCASDRGPAPVATEVRKELTGKEGPKLHLELIEKMLEGGRAHAALAHLDSLGPDAARPEAQLLRAEALRRTGQLEAAWKVYEPLLHSAVAAPAWRGLGLIKADQGDLVTSIAWLRRARDLSPTAGRIRNDLGYALLLNGELEQARIELVTALELEGGVRAARNLVLVLLIEGQPTAADRVARRHEIDAAAVDRLRRRADRMRAGMEQGG